MPIPTIEVRQENGKDIAIMNATDLPNEQVLGSMREISTALTEWLTSISGPTRRSRVAGMLDRNAYVLPSNPLQAMALAREAVASDDIIGGTCDVTEGLIWQGVKWEGEEADDVDVFNQNAADVNLDAYLRAAYRELYTCSQVVTASWWEQKTYTVRGFNPPEKADPPKPDPLTGIAPPPEMPKRGQRRRKKYSVYVPTQLTILDSLKVIPVGNRLWGGDRLAWHGTAEEMEIWDSGLDSPSTQDPTFGQLILGRYTPSRDEAVELTQLGVDPKNLLELNPIRVWRHTMTRPSYARWPDVMLKRTFRLLDLKQQLRDADRVALIGAANYILLVRKGDKDAPAYQDEIDHLEQRFKVLAKLPIIVSDHRLQIDIITPATDFTIAREKYDVLDSRLLAATLGAFSLGSTGTAGNAQTVLTMGRMVGRLLESRRHMLKRAVEERLAQAICDLNPDTFEGGPPNLAFTPRQVQLDNDPQIIQMVMALRAQNELSRESALEFAGFDQGVEADRRRYEAEAGLDDIFKTAIPFNSPANNAVPGQNPANPPGKQGGRPAGGGQPSKNPTGGGNTTGGSKTTKART